MGVKKSHFRTAIEVTCVSVAVILPVLLTLRASWTVGNRVLGADIQEIDKTKTQELRSQTRTLSELVESSIQTVRMRSEGILSQSNLQAEVNDGSIIAVADLQKGKFLPPFLDKELLNAAKLISNSDLETSGMSLFPVSIKSTDGKNAVAVAFKNGNSTVIAVFNPAQVFKSLNAWSNQKEWGVLWGFLVDRQGKVLIHSEPSLTGANFFGQTIFQEAIAPLFRGQRTSGAGEFGGLRVSYERLGNLPYAVVAERQNHTASSLSRIKSAFRDFKNVVSFQLTTLIAICLASVIAIFALFRTEWALPVFKAKTVEKRAKNDAVLEYFQSEQLKKAEEEFAEKTKEIEFLRSNFKKSQPPLGPRNPS